MLYEILNFIFAPLLNIRPMFAEALIALILTFIITLFYRFLTNPIKLKQLRERAKELNKQIKEIQKKDPEKAKQMMNEVLSITHKQTMANLKPMLATLLLIFTIFPWMAHTFNGAIVNLPFELPFFGSDFGWLMWYILISIPASQIFRKLLGVDI